MGSNQQFKATGTFADGTTQDLTASVVWSSSSTSTATIDASGLATTVAAGSATITATYSSTSGQTTLTVTPATLVSISVTPSNPTFAAGTSVQFTATATYSDGTTQDITSSVTWSSSGPAVQIDSTGLATGESVGSGSITATLGSVSSTTNVSISPAKLTSLAISPTDPSIAAGTSQQFTITGYFSDGSQQDLTSQASWTSSSNAVSINSSGLATGNTTGSATISGSYGGSTASTTITITPATLVSITISPSNPSIAVGTSVQLHATGTYSDGSTQDLTSSLNWTSSSNGVVSVSSSGVATGVGQGNATITGTSGGVTKSISVAITSAELVSINVSPSSASIATGTTQQFTATGTFSDSTTQDLTSQVSWQSSSSAASISASGLATGASAGSATITATESGVTSNGATLTITSATLQSIAITPSNPTAAAGNTTQLTATGTYSDSSTQNLTSTVSWTSSNSSVASVSAAGVVKAVAPGTATITATDGSVSSSVTFTSSGPVLTSLTITPQSPSAPSGETVQLTVTGNFSDGSTQDETASATYSSSNGNVGSVNSAGLVTAGAQGTVTLTAAVGSINSSVSFTSSAPVLISIALTPSSPSIPAGETQQLAATGLYSDRTTQILTTIATWASSNTSAATVNSTGLVTTIKQGSTTISATYTGVSGSISVTVQAAALVGISISPDNPSQPAGSAQQFTATGTYSDGSTGDVTNSATWSSSDATVATIASNGVATTKKQGSTTIAASLNSFGDSTTLTVTAAQLESINVTPVATPDSYHANSRTVQIGEARAMAASDGTHTEGILNGVITTIALGTEQQFTATGTYTDGSTHDITQTATWTSTLSTVAQITDPGLALGTALGSTVINAAQDTVSGGTTLNVTPAILASISIVPVNPSAAAGTVVQFVATGVFTDGSTQDITATANWSSSSPTVATISSGGLATAIAAGTTTIECAQGSTNNSTTLTVTPASLVSISLSPASATIPKGLTQQFTVSGTYSDGSTHDLTASATFASSNTSVATISSSGLATANGAGTTNITAQVGTFTGSAALTVNPAQLLSITITPPTASIAAGTIQQFVAYGNYSDGTTPIITPLVSWTSSSPAIATIAATGTATALTVGSSTISATLGSATGTATLTVSPATLVSIAISPLAPTIPLGGSTQFSATGTFTDLSTQDLTSTVTWTSSLTSVAVITNGGLATSAGVGVTTITAKQGSVSGTAVMTVTAASLISISLSPSNVTCQVGNTTQLTALGLYTGNTQINISSLAAWSTTNPAVATVNSSGLVTCVGTGSATVQATLLVISGTTSVTVTAATLQSITVTAATSSPILGLLDQVTAIGHYSDGSTANITSSVTWTVSPALLATVTPTGGLIVVSLSGQVTVTATSGSVQGSTVVQGVL